MRERATPDNQSIKVRLGNFGDHKSFGSGVQELRINYSPGYRIYYGIHEDEVILLLIGGLKNSLQGFR